MKSYFYVILSVVLAILVFTSSAKKVIAGDMMPGSSDVKVLLDNDEFKVSEATRPPGTIVAMHTHPKFFAYYIDAAKVKLSAPDGKETVKDIPAGKLLWFPEGTSHALEVMGTANQHVLVVEWK
jgi:quercetin dioxygenase-like cupin family protein